MKRTYKAVSCANSEDILKQNLLLSPDIQSGRLACRPLFGTSSAASAYAAVVAQKLADVLIFVHQDVYLPSGWLDRLYSVVEYLDSTDPKWVAIGSYGAAADGAHVGYIYDVSNARITGRPVDTPTKVSILDEIVIVVNTASGINFDPGLPGYHMYGTQIGLAAARAGQSIYVGQLPVVHNSQSIRTLDDSFEQAWKYIARNWADVLPVPNLMCKAMDGTMWPLQRWRVHNRIQLIRGRRRLYQRSNDVRSIARTHGLE